jgi:hypothetical protein
VYLFRPLESLVVRLAISKCIDQYDLKIQSAAIRWVIFVVHAECSTRPPSVIDSVSLTVVFVALDTPGIARVKWY